MQMELKVEGAFEQRNAKGDSSDINEPAPYGEVQGFSSMPLPSTGPNN
jgi:hypothetical protein